MSNGLNSQKSQPPAQVDGLGAFCIPEAKPKPWFLKPKRTREQIAVEGRSPNRKKRKPRIINTQQNIKTARQIKIDRIANGLALGQTMEEASINAGCGHSYGRQVDDPKAIAKFEAAKAEYEEQVRIAKGELGSRIVRITQRVGDLLLKTKNNKLLLSGGLSVMKGTGVMQGDGPAVAIDNSQKSINIIVADGETKDLMEKAKERLLGNGD